jgi:nickel transport protein
MRQYIKNAIAFTMAVAGMWMVATFSFAHYLWIQEADGAYAVCRGTIGERLDPYNPSCVTQISAKTLDGTGLPITRTNEKKRVVFTTNEKPAIVAVTSEWGDRVNTTRGKKLMNRQVAEAAGLTVVSAFTSTQFSKTLCAPSGINCQPLGLSFELVPLTDPMTLTPGTPTAFKLLFDGRPLAGISILTNLDQESKTDANGVAQFSFEKSGVHLLYATHQVPAEKDSGLDFMKFMTFLTFEVK